MSMVAPINVSRSFASGSLLPSHLLQCGVRDAIARDAQVSQAVVNLVEELHERPCLGGLVRQDVCELMT